MSRFRNALPQLGGDLFLTDAGLETDLIFNRGVPVPEFAAHTLLSDPQGRAALEAYFDGFLDLAKTTGAGFILDAVTWKAHRRWAEDLGATPEALRAANEAAVAFAASLRDRAGATPIVIGALIGPRGDAYQPERRIEAEEAEAYFAEQLGWLASTEVDMVTGLTFNQAGEAVGLVRAAQALGLPVVISFTVETDGRLPDGQPLAEAITEVDDQTGQGPAYYMVNCAHPDHFAGVLANGGDWTRRIRGVRSNASRRSHAELDEAPDLDAGDPDEFGRLHAALHARMPWINVWGACCGGDLRHVRRIAEAVTA